ncbi:MAG: hypothetical protein QXP67_01805 [Desulfurococcaceae archaeon]
MTSSDLMSDLTRGKKLFVSSHAGLLVKLAILMIKSIVLKGVKPAIMDEQGLLLRYIPLDLLGSLQLVLSTQEACKNHYLIVFEPRLTGFLKTCQAPNILVFTKPRGLYPAGFVKVFLKRVASTNHYLLRSPEMGLAVRVELTEHGITIAEKPKGVYGEAYEILKNAMSNYGEITVKDAVRVISLELNLDKLKARQVLQWLTRNGYLRVVKGRLSLA